jgi:PTS system fructose-specific IIB component/fructose-specific PTS system IIB-like component
MAAEQLEKTGRELGHEVRVETQGAMGVENELSSAEIAAAECVILAIDIEIEMRERFAGMRIIEVPAQQAIRDPRSIYAQLEG